MDAHPPASAEAAKELIERVMASPCMPSLPAVAAEVLDLVEEEEVDLGRIADAVHKDAALATRVLKTVNSSFYGQAYSVGTVNHALVVLGLRAVKTLTLGFSLVETFNNDEAAGSAAFDVAGYWRRSLLTAVAAKQLAEAVRLDCAEECFLGGLLRDLGVMCLHQALGIEYGEVLEEATHPAGPWGEALARAEVEAFGTQHAALAAELCHRWRLPSLLTALIEHHHDPREADEDHRLAVACVHGGGLAAAVFMTGEEEGSDGDASRTGTALALFREAADRLQEQAGFPVDAEALLDSVHSRTAEMRRLFELPATAESDAADLLRRARQAQEGVALEAARDADRLEGEASRLKIETEMDSLTRLPNRRRFNRELQQACDADAGGFALLMLDVDHFKAVNDGHGHDAGDAVLAEIAETLRSACATRSPAPVVCRLGGEEFAVLVPGADLLEGARLAERVRLAVSARRTPLPSGGDLAVTVSAGVCLGAAGDDVNAVYREADRALYAAKTAGRDTVRAFRAAA